MPKTLAIDRQTRLLGYECLLFLVALWVLHRLVTHGFTSSISDANWPAPVLGLGTTVLGIGIVRGISGLASREATSYLGAGRAGAVRVLLSVVLYVILAVAIASATQVDLSGIAVSGAVTGVVVGIAAQASLSNAVAGVVILFSRPFRTGQFVTVRSAAFAGSEYTGEVGEITLFYTKLFSGPQEIHVPNSAMMTSVVTLRPQSLEVYIPVLIPPDQWGRLSTSDLTRQLKSALPPNRNISVVVERVEGGQVQIAVRASLAGDEERTLLERAVLRAIQPIPIKETTPKAAVQ
ncbi:MAG TPA: mechanosensitive ion channel domain-containing protein [Chloroflexota bacterium]|nr:mechanosensitive ion channel domain-containing protein [Chloroflexota bacterium]